MAGITLTGGRYCPDVSMASEASKASMRRLKSTGANWVAIIVTQYQYAVNATSIHPLYDPAEVRDPSGYYTFVTLKDEELRAAIQYAHSLGLKVLLKPHVDLLHSTGANGTAPGHGATYWRGDIGGCYPQDATDAPFTPDQWTAWFASYEKFFLPYAVLAQSEAVSMLSMNTELYCPNRQEARWRELVQKTRGVYKGILTTSSINGREEEVQWWDALDVIGVDAYYKHHGATEAQLVASWQPIVRSLEALSRRFGGKRVAFTEIGMCSGQCSRQHTPSRQDYEWHATQYEAVFRAFQGESWFAGSFWWNWDTDPGSFGDDDCLTPQGKPAEDILRRYYRSTEPKPPFVGQGQCIGVGKCTC